MTDRNGSHVSTTDAINAMRQRGIDNPESLVSSTTADRIVETCNQAAREGWSKRLTVWKIQRGGVDTSDTTAPGAKRKQMQAAFDEFAATFPVSSVAESHKRLQRRRDYDEDCAGVMVVIGTDWPSLDARCDACGFEASYPFRALVGGVLPAEPPVSPRPVPDPQPMVPPEQHRSQPVASTRELHPPRMDERSLRWRR